MNLVKHNADLIAENQKLHDELKNLRASNSACWSELYETERTFQSVETSLRGTISALNDKIAALEHGIHLDWHSHDDLPDAYDPFDMYGHEAETANVSGVIEDAHDTTLEYDAKAALEKYDTEQGFVLVGLLKLINELIEGHNANVDAIRELQNQIELLQK